MHYDERMSGDPSYLSAYREAVHQHGCEFESTLWANEKTQRVRFDVFARMCPLAGRRILDAGCSRGDLAAYLIEKKIEYQRFIGLDAVGELIQFAQNRKLPRSEFHCGDFVTHPKLLTTGDPQVIIFSGSLNTMKLDTVMDVLDAAWQATRETLMFNFLSDCATEHAPRQTGPAYRLSTMVLLEWALDQSDHVAFRQDYFPHGHDATIRMDKTKTV